MQLSTQDTERFYRIWWPLLRYVNAQRHIVPELPAAPEKGSLSSQDAHQIRNTLWESDELRETFIAENPANLPATDLAMVANWSHRVEGDFFIFRHLKHYTVFLTQEEPPQAYGVLGLVSPIQEVIPWPLPVLVKAVLLPFEDKIIYDGLLVPYSVIFGSGIRRSLNQAYRLLQERDGVITTLQPPHPEETRQRIHRGNQKILAAFRKDLAASGLSLNMIEHHASTIAVFNDSYLLMQEPPCSLLDVDSNDLKKYLNTQGKSADRVSFKRLVRFLLNTGRIDWDVATDMQNCLKQHPSGKASKSRRS
ncbi:MAG: hypothetical protein U1F76_29125 [Candidatus Competibacteraceae bacterium]